MSSLQVSESEFENSVEFYQEEEVRNKLFDLRKVTSSDAPQLSKEDLGSILEYFCKVFRELDDVSQIELLDLDIMFTQCEDKVFHRFGVEKGEAEDQAREMAKNDEGLRRRLEEYRRRARQKQAVFQGNLNVSHFQGA
jgi:hypothetical protein